MSLESLREEIAAEKERRDKAQPMTGDQDLFVLLAMLGEALGDVHSAALAHVRTVAVSDLAAAASTTSREFRARLVQLSAKALKTLELYDAGQIAIYGDAYSQEPTKEEAPQS